ncbi:Probable LRR receptor-like serine/threonine-protein kinase At2g24230 [Linum perenne]
MELLLTTSTILVSWKPLICPGTASVVKSHLAPALGSLLSLRVLKLNGNQFKGRIPVGILRCISLDVMDFSLNKLDGSLPYGFGAAFSKLQSLDLSGNGIDGREPDFS